MYYSGEKRTFWIYRNSVSHNIYLIPRFYYMSPSYINSNLYQQMLIHEHILHQLLELLSYPTGIKVFS